MSRTRLLTLHRWVGACLAIFLLMQGFSGSVLVFRDTFDRVLHPALVVAPMARRLPLQTLADTVHAAHPDATINRLEVGEGDDQAVLFKLKAKAGGALILTAVDPYRGTILRDGGLSAWPTEWVFTLHESLFSGPVGEVLIGVEGLGLLFVVIVGLIHWWPARGRFRQAFRVKLDGSADLRWRTLHRSVGAGVAVLLLTSATTGVLMVWKDPLRNALSHVTRVERKPAPTVAKEKGRDTIPLDQLVAMAQAEQGGARLLQIRLTSGGRVVAVYLEGRHSLRADATTQIYYNAYTGARLADYVAGQMAPASEAIDWLYTVHTGLWGGVVTRLLMLVGALGLAGMSMTGPWLWWSRSRKLRRAKRAKIAANAA